MSLEENIYKYCLKNAFDHDGKAAQGAIIGKLINDDPSIKEKMKDVAPLIGKTLKEVNALTRDEQERILREKYPELLEKRKEEPRTLPELKNAENGKVVMRMAPNPNGPLHIGHARMIILNDEYCKKYNGKLLLRFDDTDPKNENKKPMREAYSWAKEDLEWLGVEWSEEFKASERLEKYYALFWGLLEQGNAYVCTCPGEEWSQLVRRERKYCPCRSLSVDENLERWQKMLDHEFKEGHAVGRMKTPEGEKDPAVIDWPTFRIIDSPDHPFQKEAHVWPMLDFASAHDDQELGITHILRGKDLFASQKKQKLIFDYYGWEYPETILYGKFMTKEEMVISKREIMQGIKEKRFNGFDDPRLSVLRAFRKRGIKPEAIRNYILSFGVGQNETTVDLDALHAENRKLIDEESNRYFAVFNPVRLSLEGLEKESTTAPLYPDDESRGVRELKIKDSSVFVSSDDLKTIEAGEKFRLLQLANFEFHASKAKFVEETGAVKKKLHWVSESVPLTVTWLDGRERKALIEKSVLKEKPGNHIQLERVGYAYLTKVSEEGVEAYYTHD